VPVAFFDDQQKFGVSKIKGPTSAKKLQRGKRIDYDDDDEEEKNRPWFGVATLAKNEMLTGIAASTVRAGNRTSLHLS